VRIETSGEVDLMEGDAALGSVRGPDVQISGRILRSAITIAIRDHKIVALQSTLSTSARATAMGRTIYALHGNKIEQPSDIGKCPDALSWHNEKLFQE
jgi:hypothetical protein